ncbi:MAG: SRPBCC domain-containing protein [Vicinamibacterales bacterium]
MMRPLALLVFLTAQASPVSVVKIAEPDKALRFEVVVPAPLDEVWNAFTTQNGLQTWLWKDTRVDLRAGGEWTVVYTPTATGGGTIESFVPRTEIVIRALAPEQFPTVRSERTTATFRFEPMGSATTKVTLVQTGWKPGAEWDAAYDYLAKGNAQLLTQLHTRFVSGPYDWSKLK